MSESGRRSTMNASYKSTCEIVNQKPSSPSTIFDVATSPVIDADRLRARMIEKGISQSELARRIGVSQQNVSHLLSGNAQGSKRLHLIARELETTPAYLTGETDDPDQGAPPPAPAPTAQFVMMPVAIPAEPALEAMFRGLIRSMPGLEGDALAHELAKLLPIGLQQLRGPLRFERPVDVDAPPEDAEAPSNGNHERRRASRT